MLEKDYIKKLEEASDLIKAQQHLINKLEYFIEKNCYLAKNSKGEAIIGFTNRIITDVEHYQEIVDILDNQQIETTSTIKLKKLLLDIEEEINKREGAL